ncbi:MAG TPA: GNAT family protein [Candidatus Sulfotelmatobacter sp.]|nr:GNAT family protein [Candidatus Sulfotelmatobacter sp.]
MFGPIIQGNLVRLRPPRTEEATAMATWFEDLEVTRFIKLRNPPSVEAEKEFLERMSRDPDAVFWAVEHDGKLVGGTSIVRIDWKDGHGTTGTLLGDKTAWGKGLARELMQLRADYAFTQLPLRKLKSGYLEGNVASAKAQTAAGYREVGRWHGDKFIDGKWTDHVLTELMREDWAKAKSV